MKQKTANHVKRAKRNEFQEQESERTVQGRDGCRSRGYLCDEAITCAKPFFNAEYFSDLTFPMESAVVIDVCTCCLSGSRDHESGSSDAYPNLARAITAMSKH